MALKVVDRAIQVHGAEGISQDQPLAYFYASLRTLKFADVRLSYSSSYSSSSFLSLSHSSCSNDSSRMHLADKQGPDEVHIQQQGKQELKRVPMIRERYGRIREKSGRLTSDPERLAKL
jgi:acyl-CoA dehydrogenase